MNMVPRGYIGRTKGLIHVYKNVSRYSVARKHGPRGGVVVTDSVADSVSGPHRSIGSIESAKGVVVSEKKEKDQSVRFGFSAGGLLFPFYIGVVKGLTTAGYMSERTKLAGASAGSLIAACVNSGLSMDTVTELCEELMEDCRVHGTRGRLGIVLEKFLDDALPEDAHVRCRHRTHVAVSSLSRSSVTPVLVNEFESRDDLIRALMTSCHIPFWLDGRLTSEFRGRTHLDGGVTNFIPLPPGDEPGVRISCFGSKQLAAVYDIGIAPDVFEQWPHSLPTMVQWAFSPAEDHFQKMLIDRGECDALSWVREFEKTQRDTMHA